MCIYISITGQYIPAEILDKATILPVSSWLLYMNISAPIMSHHKNCTFFDSVSDDLSQVVIRIRINSAQQVIQSLQMPAM